MPRPKLKAYDDCNAIFARARASPRGVRVPMSSPADAESLQHRMNKFRQKAGDDDLYSFTVRRVGASIEVARRAAPTIEPIASK